MSRVLDTAATAPLFVCHCYRLTESAIRQVVESLDEPTFEQLQARTCAGSGCTACQFRIRQLLADSTDLDAC